VMTSAGQAYSRRKRKKDSCAHINEYRNPSEVTKKIGALMGPLLWIRYGLTMRTNNCRN
jgi:hypothetical protein